MESAPASTREPRRLWRVGGDTSEQLSPGPSLTTTPEFACCESFSERVWFDQAALALATSPDEAWVLDGSDTPLQRLIMHEQTVLQGPHIEVLGHGGMVMVSDMAEAGARWPLLEANGAFTPNPQGSMLVVALGCSIGSPPIGTVTLSRSRPAPFADWEANEAVPLAQLVAGKLFRRWRAAHDVDLIEGVIQDQRHLAAGLLASFLGVRVSQAMAIMRARAFASRTTLAEFAEGILAVLGTPADS